MPSRLHQRAARLAKRETRRSHVPHRVGVRLPSPPITASIREIRKLLPRGDDGHDGPKKSASLYEMGATWGTTWPRNEGMPKPVRRSWNEVRVSREGNATYATSRRWEAGERGVSSGGVEAPDIL